MRDQHRFCIKIVEAHPVFDMLNYRLTCQISFKVSGEQILTRKINKQKNRLPELKKPSEPSIQRLRKSSATMTTDSQKHFTLKNIANSICVSDSTIQD